jgi:uncharacterized glyoxalase superfamily protein PhnB
MIYIDLTEILLNGSIDEVYQVIKERNIDIELRDEPWGDRHFAIVDPNGVGIDIVAYSEPGE